MPRDPEKRRQQNRDCARRRYADPVKRAAILARTRERYHANPEKIRAYKRALHAKHHPPKPKPPKPPEPPKPPMRYEDRKKLRPQAEKTALRSRAVKRGMARAKELRQKQVTTPPPEVRASRVIDMAAVMAAMRGVA